MDKWVEVVKASLELTGKYPNTNKGSKNQIFLDMLFLLDVELIMYKKFQKLLMTGCRDIDKKHQK